MIQASQTNGPSALRSISYDLTLCYVIIPMDFLVWRSRLISFSHVLAVCEGNRNWHDEKPPQIGFPSAPQHVIHELIYER